MIDELERLVSDKDFKGLTSYLQREYGRLGDDGFDHFANLMLTTGNPVIRNELALVLSDTKDQRFIKLAVDLICMQSTQGYRGTFLFGLQQYTLGNELLKLKDSLVVSGIEESKMTLTLFKDNWANLSTDEKQEVFVFLERQKKRISQSLENCEFALVELDQQGRA